MANDEIIEWVYWAVPDVQPNQITGLTTDTSGMVVMTIQTGIEGPLGLWAPLATQLFTVIQVRVTPQAYISWYTNKLSAISASKNASIFTFLYNTLNASCIHNGKSFATSIEYTTFYLQQYNYYWKPLAGLNIGNYDNLAGAPTSQLYGLTTNQLYALIKAVNVAVYIPAGTGAGLYAAPAIQLTPAQSAQQGVDVVSFNTAVAAQQMTSATATAQASVPPIVTYTQQNVISPVVAGLTKAEQAIDPWLQAIKYAPYFVIGGAVILGIAFAWSLSKTPASETIEAGGKATGHVISAASKAAVAAVV